MESSKGTGVLTNTQNLRLVYANLQAYCVIRYAIWNHPWFSSQCLYCKSLQKLSNLTDANIVDPKLFFMYLDPDSDSELNFGSGFGDPGFYKNTFELQICRSFKHRKHRNWSRSRIQCLSADFFLERLAAMQKVWDRAG